MGVTCQGYGAVVNGEEEVLWVESSKEKIWKKEEADLQESC